MPPILLALDRLSADGTNLSTAAAERRLIKLTEVLSALDEWYQQNISESATSSWWFTTGLRGDSYIWFPNITMANFLTHFWAFWILCVTNIRRLMVDYPTLKENAIYIDGKAPEHEAVSASLTEAANRILQSVEFLIQDDMKLFGVASAPLPLRTVCTALQNGDIRGDSTCLSNYQSVCARVVQKGCHDIALSSVAEPQAL